MDNMNNGYTNGQYAQYQPQDNGGYNSQFTNSPVLEEPVSVGEWIVAMLLMIIPCINIVMMFIFAFSKTEKKSKSNYFKAVLIWTLIVVVIEIIAGIILAATGASLMDYLY